MRLRESPCNRWYTLIRTSTLVAIFISLPTITRAAETITLTDIPNLIEKLDQTNPNTIKQARETLLRYAYEIANTDQREPLANLLCEHLAARDKHKIQTRVTLCRILGFIGDKESAIGLYKAMNELNPQLQEMARWALVLNPSSSATDALVGGLQIAADDLLVGVINGLGQRGDLRAVPPLTGQIYNPYAPAARATLDALAQLPNPLSLQAIDQAVQDEKPGALDALLDLANNLLERDMRSEAHKALVPLVDRKDLTVAQRSRWLFGLGHIGGDIPTQFVMRYVNDDNAHIRGAALTACVRLPGVEATSAITSKTQASKGIHTIDLIQVLAQRGDWMNDDTADFLVQSASNEDQVIRVAAINAMASAGVDRGIGTIINTLDEPDSPARQAAERAVNHMPGQFVTKQIIYTLRGNPGTKRATLVRALGRRGDKVALKQIRKATEDTDPAVRAAGFEALARFGPSYVGVITTWHLIGPFPNPDNAMWNTSYPPEKQVTLDKPIQLDGQTLTWKQYGTPTHNGIIDMGQALADKEHVGAYAYAEITVDKAQDILLKVGSDDGIAIWINHQKVHAKNIRRLLKRDEDTASAHLAKGTNTILVKILNGVYDWGFAVRLTTPQNTPIAFRQMN